VTIPPNFDPFRTPRATFSCLEDDDDDFLIMDFRFDAFRRSAVFRTLMFASDDERLNTELEFLRLKLKVASGTLGVGRY
jgi:hypothetical protein